ncbi:MAG: outer membrane beta-barrel protein [Bacteroidota bacterium]
MRTTFLLLFFLTMSTLAAQFSGGFRAGLNFVSLDGPTEMSADGMRSFESFNNTTGFHVGATFAYAFTDLFGVKADLMYSQKGGEIVFEGPSYFYLYSDRQDREGEIIFGQLNGETDVINSYIDIPVVAYYRFGALELEGGFSAGLLAGSRGSGGKTYTTTSAFGDAEIIFNIDGSYISTTDGGAGGDGIISLSPTPPNPDVINFPDIITPYYNSNNDENLFRRLDFGLVAGVSFFLNSGLYLGVRYQHGLTDVTNGENDLRLTNEDREGRRVFNTEDADFNRAFQASVGFRF